MHIIISLASNVTNELVALLARLIVMCITERAQRYLSDTLSDKS